VPSPHVVVIFKDPLSVAARTAERRQKDPLAVLQRVVVVHQRLAAIAANTKCPLFLISYEKAMANLPEVLGDAARFAGIGSYDEAAVIAGIKDDGQQYFKAAAPFYPSA